MIGFAMVDTHHMGSALVISALNASIKTIAGGWIDHKATRHHATSR